MTKRTIALLSVIAGALAALAGLVWVFGPVALFATAAALICAGLFAVDVGGE